MNDPHTTTTNAQPDDDDADQGVIEGLCEAVAAKIGFAEFVALDHGSHGAVDDQNALDEGGMEIGDALVAIHVDPFVVRARLSGLRANALITAKWGGRFSREVTSQRSTSKPASWASQPCRSRGRKPWLM